MKSYHEYLIEISALNNSKNLTIKEGEEFYKKNIGNKNELKLELYI